jgi:hypothetical protein
VPGSTAGSRNGVPWSIVSVATVASIALMARAVAMRSAAGVIGTPCRIFLNFF